jgi:hypothetical protein
MHTQLFHYIIQMPKAQTSVAYRLLESQEGLACYSTLPPDPPAHGPQECRLELHAHTSLRPEFLYLIDLIKKHCHATVVLAQEEDDATATILANQALANSD